MLPRLPLPFALLAVLAQCAFAQAPSFNCSSQPPGAFTRITLTNALGMSLSLIPYGATITNIVFPAANGPIDLLLGWDDAVQYCNGSSHPYFGASIGRIANRIANGSFTLNGQTYTTPLNEVSAFGGDTLHGGWVGTDRRVWDVVSVTASAAVLQYVSSDGEEGFPGEVTSRVAYALTDDNEWTIDWLATTTSPVAVCSPTNHAYFNLAANIRGETTVLDHVLTMPNAGHFVGTDMTLIPTGAVLSVDDYPAMDFTAGKPIGRDLNSTVLPYPGYDTAFVLTPKAAKRGSTAASADLPLAASIYSPLSGVGMEVFTDAPSVQVYSGNFLDSTIPRKASQGGPSATYAKYGAVTFETQMYPDALHHASFPSVVLVPGAPYTQKSVYHFYSI